MRKSFHIDKQSVRIFANAFFPQFVFAFVCFMIFPFAVSWLGEVFDSAYLVDWGQRDRDKNFLISKPFFMGVMFGLGGVYGEYRLHTENQSHIKRVAKVFVPLFFGVLIVFAILPFIALKYITFLEDFAKSWLEFGLSFPVIIASVSAFGLLVWGYYHKSSEDCRI